MEPNVIHNTAQHRYEIWLGDEKAGHLDEVGGLAAGEVADAEDAERRGVRGLVGSLQQLGRRGVADLEELPVGQLEQG